MRSGVMLGSACMVDGMIDRIDAELGGGATVVATGGIARFVLPMCRHAIEYDRDLLLKGLALLYDNKRRETCPIRAGHAHAMVDISQKARSAAEDGADAAVCV